MTYLSSTFPIWLQSFVERLARGIVYAPLTAPDGWRDAMHLPNGLGLLVGLLVAVVVIVAACLLLAWLNRPKN